MSTSYEKGREYAKHQLDNNYLDVEGLRCLVKLAKKFDDYGEFDRGIESVVEERGEG